jgi:L-ascorbate metabolism protein UlaG (beta-lactamase superfamily)
MKIHLLNHASILLEYEEVRLLMDPWLMGTCFEDGWGLRYQNAEALQLASTATHLWISHFHGDHFHAPTLRALAQRNPNVVCLGNASHNFRMDKALHQFGFMKIQPIGERTSVRLTEAVEVERYPTTGIDNMLVIRTREGTIVNYNDCNIPLRAQRAFAKHIGPIAVFLNNFNHAGKLLFEPLPPVEQIKAMQMQYFVNNFTSFNPRYVIPFASFHYYRAPESSDQNDSLLNVDDLCALDARIVPLHIGETAEFQEVGYLQLHIFPHTQDITGCSPIPLQRQTTHTFQELRLAADKYCQEIRRGFGGICRLLPSFNLEIADLNVHACLTAQQGLRHTSSQTPHVKAHSAALYNWWTKPYGTDSFFVGAHFTFVGDPMPLRRWLLAGLLVDNKLHLRALLTMLFHAQGRRFLWNRREESLAILLRRRFVAGIQR